jgi:Tol biopolymer transport system component
MIGLRRLAWTVLAGAMVLAVAGLGAQSTNSAAAALRAAKDVEMVKGDPSAAIKQYQSIVDSFGKTDRAIAAQALLRMAECYRKIGDAQAVKVYQRLVKDFANQPEAAEAQAQLSLIASGAAPALRPRLICETCGDPQATMSRDGRWMVVTDRQKDGDLLIQDLSTFQTTQLFAGSLKDSSGLPQRPVLSPDSKQIAFALLQAASCELRIMPAESHGAARVLLTRPENEFVLPLAWTKDGRILVRLVKVDNSTQLAWVAVSTKIVTILKPLEWRVRSLFETASVSPDGKYVAYAALAVNPTKPSANARLLSTDNQHIYVLAADGFETDLTPGTNASFGPVWTSDGTHLIYASNINGTTDFWAVPMRAGKPSAPAFVLSKDVGDVTTIGVTDAGVFHFERNRRGIVWSSIVTLASGNPNSANNSERFVGSRPRFSPDGKMVAFNRPKPPSGETQELVVRSLATGAERTFHRDGMDTLPVQWFGDSKGLLTLITGVPGGAWTRLDLESGEFQRLVANRADPAFLTHWGVKALAPDGKTIYFGAYDPAAPVLNRVVALDIASGRYRVVYRLPGGNDELPQNGGQLALSVSPDGLRLAIARVDPKAMLVHVGVVTIDGNGYRELSAPLSIRGAGSSSLAYSDAVAWSGNGRLVFFSVPAVGDPSHQRIMQVSADGGAAQFTGVETKIYLDAFHPSPDGTRIAFSHRGAEGGTQEFWALDVREALRARK